MGGNYSDYYITLEEMYRRLESRRIAEDFREDIEDLQEIKSIKTVGELLNAKR